ncbi:PREDICTED: thioredoxin-like protein 4B isoform X1 [Myotis davidii]|uniref:thioredoxin-like protein 4B isoform X1 n=1 Tax=Myotis davidii TaxID=225400 RepID=UPI0007672A81|nr:PREDICTED: thioredoxin-like protein 4B isoform X1 [Myotis davidii]XP_015414304.1 PREDICTED: thioredoxin-like protein 4B isoform X1 [Myotis davidii]
MSFLLPKLTSKTEVDEAIKSTAEKVLVLRFGRDEDPVCLQLDDILSKTSSDLSKMAAIYLVDVDQTPVYTHYFDISYIPSTVFFFNGQHMKVDYGSLSLGEAGCRGVRTLRQPMGRSTDTLANSQHHLMSHERKWASAGIGKSPKATPSLHSPPTHGESSLGPSCLGVQKGAG